MTTPRPLRPRRGARRAAASLALALLACAWLPAASTPPAAPTPPGPFAAGADLSFLPVVEAHGALFRDATGMGSALQVLHRHGLGWVRLRLWHTPEDGHSGLPEVVALARRARAEGFRLLLDFHYSDTWADPGKQTLPQAWEGLAQAALEDSVRTYTRDALRTFRSADALPDMVQLGNEISAGCFWDAGRVGGKFDTPAHWRTLGALLGAATRGVREAEAPGARVRTLIHLDTGGNAPACRWFFDHLIPQGVEFDAIGVSFYPWWQGALGQLGATLDDLATRYGKDLYVVETAYPWTLKWFDSKDNMVGEDSQLHAGYPATPEGQAAFVRAVAETVRRVPGGRGRGVFYWGAEWVAAPMLGSPWENNALFDNTGTVLPAADSLGAFSRDPR